jgi:hypothetical protein
MDGWMDGWMDGFERIDFGLFVFFFFPYVFVTEVVSWVGGGYMKKCDLCICFQEISPNCIRDIHTGLQCRQAMTPAKNRVSYPSPHVRVSKSWNSRGYLSETSHSHYDFLFPISHPPKNELVPNENDLLLLSPIPNTSLRPLILPNKGDVCI